MFWNLLLCIWFWAEYLISKQSFWFLWAVGFYVPVYLRLESSCMSKMLPWKKMTPVRNFCSTQSCTGNLWEAQDLCLIYIKVLFTYTADLCLLPWCIPSKSMWINGSTFKILHTCTSFYSLHYLYLHTHFVLLACSVPQCCLHRPSSVLTTDHQWKWCNG